MSDDIRERFRQVQPTVQRPMGYVHADITRDGRLVYRNGKAASIILWLFTLALCIAFAWVSLSSPEPRSILDYAFLAASGLLAILLAVSFPYLLSPVPYFEVDPALRRITVYGGFPNWRPREVIPIDDIRLFVSYVCSWASENVDSSCSVVLENGEAHPLIDRLGSISPDSTAKTLGYICNKLAVRVTEHEPTLGLLAWTGPAFKPKRGEPLDVERMLDSAEVLYDPESGGIPD